MKRNDSKVNARGHEYSKHAESIVKSSSTIITLNKEGEKVARSYQIKNHHESHKSPPNILKILKKKVFDTVSKRFNMTQKGAFEGI